MLSWRWILVTVVVVFLAACQPVTLPTDEPTSAATEEPEEDTQPPNVQMPETEVPSELTGVTWEWERTEYADGTEVIAEEPSRYTLTFLEEGTVNVQLDCNQGSGPFMVEGDNLTFGAITSTLIGCPPGSQATEFANGLGVVGSYAIEGDTLTFGLVDGGEMVMRAAGTDGAATPEATEEATEEATPEATEEASEVGAMPGEADMAENALVGTVWQWIETQYSDDSTVTAEDPSRYTITFHPDGTLEAQVDCNRGRGAYTVDSPMLTLGPLATTRMGCPPDSQADVFQQGLESVNSYVFDGDNLALSLALDTGIMFFAPAE